MTRYLADTYAFIEALGGNARYARIMGGGHHVTTAMNVQELHYAMLRAGVSVEEAERIAGAVLPLVADVPPAVAVVAARTRFRVNHALANSKSPSRMSHVDAWGYEAARALGLRFLTGDPVFRRMDGVEFVR